MIPLVLGSQSPRRKEILGYFTYPFTQVMHPFIEEHVEFQGDPKAYATEIAHSKAMALVHDYPHSALLTADTTVYCKGQIFNKPGSDKEALEMLRTLQGTCHSVFTATTVAYQGNFYNECEETKVYFRSLSEEQLQLYHSAFHGQDKAGGYGIQMAGSVIVERIDGCYYNVMGLPMNALQQVLLNVGIDLWRFLPSS